MLVSSQTKYRDYLNRSDTPPGGDPEKIWEPTRREDQKVGISYRRSSISRTLPKNQRGTDLVAGKLDQEVIEKLVELKGIGFNRRDAAQFSLGRATCLVRDLGLRRGVFVCMILRAPTTRLQRSQQSGVHTGLLHPHLWVFFLKPNIVHNTELGNIIELRNFPSSVKELGKDIELVTPYGRGA